MLNSYACHSESVATTRLQARWSRVVPNSSVGCWRRSKRRCSRTTRASCVAEPKSWRDLRSPSKKWVIPSRSFSASDWSIFSNPELKRYFCPIRLRRLWRAPSNVSAFAVLPRADRVTDNKSNHTKKCGILAVSEDILVP